MFRSSVCAQHQITAKLNQINMIWVHLKHYLKITTTCITHMCICTYNISMYTKQQKPQRLKRNLRVKCTRSICFPWIYSEPRLDRTKRGCSRQDCNDWHSSASTDTGWRSPRAYTENMTQPFCVKYQISEPALFIERSKWQIHSWKSSRNAPCGLSWPAPVTWGSSHWEAGQISIIKTSGSNSARLVMRGICNMIHTTDI